MRHTAAALVLGSFLLAAACQRGDLPDAVGSSQSEIVDGQASASGAHPATVFLWLGGGACTGTLISERVVLTAHHCLQGPSSIDVFFGNDPDAGGTWIDAESWEGHPSTDIGAITLASPAPADPIPFYRQGLTTADIGRDMTIVGFGETAGTGTPGIKNEGVTKIDQLQSDVVFVGGEGAKTCFGDSGGPAFLEENGVVYVAGVTSFGTSEDCTSGLSGQIRTDIYTEWIEDYVNITADPTCEQDGLCAEGCSEPDPDCPCAEDGFCTAKCSAFASEDPDCAGCAADGECRLDCPAEGDVDCCGMKDDTCIPGCDGGDPDCGKLGDKCEGDTDCDSVVCGTVGEKQKCTTTCTDDSGCPKGFSCLDETACWPKGGGGCAAGGKGTGTGAWLLLGLLGFGVLVRRRKKS